MENAKIIMARTGLDCGFYNLACYEQALRELSSLPGSEAALMHKTCEEIIGETKSLNELFRKHIEMAMRDVDPSFCSACGSWLQPNEGEISTVAGEIKILCDGCRASGSMQAKPPRSSNSESNVSKHQPGQENASQGDLDGPNGAKIV